METLYQIEQKLEKYKIMLPTADIYTKPALEKEIERLEWLRLVKMNERGELK